MKKQTLVTRFVRGFVSSRTLMASRYFRALGLSCGLVAVVASNAIEAQAAAGRSPEESSSNERVTPPTPPGSIESRRPLLQDINAPKFGRFKIGGGFKSTASSGRGYEMASKEGRRFRLRNEYFVSLVHDLGWGVSLMATTTRSTYGDSARDKDGAGDPSVTLVHPALYDRGNLKINGQFRAYQPVADYSVKNQLHQYAYYLFTNYRTKGGWHFFHQITPRYMAQPSYAKGNTILFLEDFLTVANQIETWMRLGLGAHSAREWHSGTPTGALVEVYPFADFNINKNILIEPRISLPVLKSGAVYESAEAAALNNYQAEIYLSMTI